MSDDDLQDSVTDELFWTRRSTTWQSLCRPEGTITLRGTVGQLPREARGAEGGRGVTASSR